MKNKFVLALLIIVAGTSVANGQKTDPNGTLSFSAGSAFPIGNFGSDDIMDENAGMASQGPVVNISYSKLVGKTIGFTVQLQAQRNPLNVKEIEKRFGELQLYALEPVWMTDPYQPLPEPVTYNYPNWHFDKHSWKLASLLLGGYGEWSCGKSNKLSFTSTATIGVSYAALPALHGAGNNSTGTADISQTKGDAFGLGYAVSGGIRSKMNDKLSFIANLSYVGTARLAFDEIMGTITTTKGTPGSPGYVVTQRTFTGTAYQSISTINITVGIGIRL